MPSPVIAHHGVDSLPDDAWQDDIAMRLWLMFPLRALAKRRFKTKRVFKTKRDLKRNGDIFFVVRFVLARFKTKRKRNDSPSLDTYFKTPNTSWVSPLASE